MRLDRFLTVNMVRPLRRALHSLSSCDRDQEGERKATFEFKLGTRNSSLPILMYHSISDTAEPNISPYYRICTNPRRFRQHMGLLKSEGYQGVTLTAGLSW